MNIRLHADDVKKVFNRRIIFENVSFVIAGQQTLLITGRNGSGKSTLVKILADILSPTSGSVGITSNGHANKTPHSSMIGLVSPYLQMYDEFTAEENIHYALAIRGTSIVASSTDKLLKKVFLFNRKDDPVRTFSSGMKQRMKYAFALAHNPPILILDEPTSNLDTDGIAMVKEIMQEQREKGILVVATNDLADVETFDLQVDLNG